MELLSTIFIDNGVEMLN